MSSMKDLDEKIDQFWNSVLFHEAMRMSYFCKLVKKKGETKMPRKTIASLEKLIESLEDDLRTQKSTIIRLQEEDRITRDELTNLLEKYPMLAYSPYAEERISINKGEGLSWSQIFFKMGELNADANYSILLQNKRHLDEELNRIREKQNRRKDDTPNR